MKKESPVRPSREAVQIQMELVPVNVSILELGKIPDMKQWFRKDECSTIFAVSPDTIQNWIDSGVLDARLINSALDRPERKHVRITRDSVVRLLNDQRRKVL